MSAQHTPVPWKTWRTENGDLAYIVRGDYEGRGRSIALCQQDVDSALIVRAVNSHDELLALARQYASECGECGGTGTVDRKAWPGGIEVDYEAPCEDCADIRAVIAKAETP